jgi:hypothetical protein
MDPNSSSQGSQIQKVEPRSRGCCGSLLNWPWGGATQAEARVPVLAQVNLASQ